MRTLLSDILIYCVQRKIITVCQRWKRNEIDLNLNNQGFAWNMFRMNKFDQYSLNVDIDTIICNVH